MVQYFKIQWEASKRHQKVRLEEDVEKDSSMNCGNVGKNVMEGLDPETHLKKSKIAEVCNNVFENWEWISNVEYSPNSCRIVLGWNHERINVMLLYVHRQVMLCQVETWDHSTSFFCSIVYACNSGKERRLAWKGLEVQKASIGQHPWVLLGDFNVTRKVEEHSAGGAFITEEMQEFIDCINMIEVDDIGSSCFNFTWTKSLKNPNCGVLKKLDRIMINDDFIAKYPDAYGLFLPYLVSDHSPAGWAANVEGFNMYKVVKKLKYLKRDLNKLNWSHGNLTSKVKDIRGELQKAQKELDNDPCNKQLRIKATQLLQEYDSAKKDELCMLRQLARIKWLTEGDKNSSYFHGILRNNVTPLEELGDILSTKLSDEDANIMVADAWGVIGEDIFLAVKDFFRNGKLLGEVNATLIALVPKIDTPNKFSDFRPIACCNEVLKGYNRASGPRRCALKIDIQKAYDTVSWSFPEKVLYRFGFHAKVIEWIMNCVTTASFSICLNGEAHGYFKSGRGLRQGDPMSLYLFTLVMEVLTLILAQTTKEDMFKFHFGCKKLKLSHMCFADDLMVICYGDLNYVKVIKKALGDFSSVSGLSPILPFNVGKLTVRYLGVPLLVKRLGCSDCKCLIDKVKAKVLCWRNRKLSYASRLQLIASVLASMQVYWASVYLTPSDSSKGKVKVAWKTICLPKNQGGLGIKPLKRWNEVLLFKQLWKIIAQQESLWAKWVNVVKLKGKSIWDVGEESSDS
ncbi:uncharacterized protein [Rutidosis leptorrhynchoides]|uniref:uncharacterized protein n=1 Tax=Rutidosis leptorrhynchoides TaxID=125765 RepID=UPI003A99216C